MAETTFDPTFNAQQIGTESSLSNWVGPYVTDMLGKGKALGEQPYQAYGGPLTAGSSDLQNKAFGGIGSLNIPTSSMGAFNPTSFTGGIAQQYMNPYIMSALQPQIDEARRQSEIDRVANSSRLTQSGAFGGSRQAIMDSENQRNLQQNIAGITGQGYSDAYTSAMNQFNTEQGRGLEAQGETNKYGLAALDKLSGYGNVQRGIETEGITADRKQFEEERDYPYKQVQYMQSLLQGLPVGTTAYNYTQPSTFGKAAGGAGDIMSLIKSYGSSA
tara:strand:+ start:167 stop:985 length:819 start_codon:yes stop_codon:yes gene_type:complete